MDPRSQVLLRQGHYFSGQLLLAGAPADGLLQQLPSSELWCWNYADYQALAALQSRAYFSVTAPDQSYDAVVLYLPKSRELTEYLLQEICAKYPAAEIFLVGEKRAGIERAAKQLAQYGEVSKLDSARHCQLWRLTSRKAPVAVPDLAALANSFKVTVGQQQLTIKTVPGVFSHGRLDRGTELLLAHLEGLSQGHYLDFGCGAGVIGCYLAKQYPNSQVSLLDVDAFALFSTQLTLQANQVQAGVIAGTGINEAPQHLAAIISNPPFHQGVHTDYAASEQMLTQAKGHLLAQGELRIVANSFLKYPPLINQHLGPCQVLAEAQGFSVYRAVAGQRSQRQ